MNPVASNRSDVKATSFLGSVDHTGLAEIAREARERKATKADDAEVPIYLWEEHMINDGDFTGSSEFGRLFCGMGGGEACPPLGRLRFCRWYGVFLGPN